MPQSQRIKASLFVTCIVDQLYPQVGVSVVRVLRLQAVKPATALKIPWV